ncbi:replication-relaxation family protein [Streptomyces sp. NPDC047917]|uniref:replication-relaxation family protein n=1 Tax=Streptomyces sp. NPDC047917 TaxID=3365491 RepID=UPI00371C44CE
MLGVLKVATADQIQRIGAPRLTCRRTGKDTPARQKQARAASHTGALSDMRKHGLTESGGTTSGGETLRNLTIKGLEAASYELGRPVTEMGSTARGAGASGATHPMTVNETVIAMLRPKPNLARMTEDPAEVRAAAQAAIDAPGGIGMIAQYWTEVPLPATGTWSTPGKGGAQADIVLTAPQDRVPLLFIEADNCHETAEELADKLEKYACFFRRKTKDTDGRERPMWRTRWTVPEARPAEVPHPPVLLVFNRLGDRNPNRTIPSLMELTHHLWAGERFEDHHLYNGKIPIIATRLRNLREHGPHGAVFLRFGRDHMQPLREAIGNPRREAADTRRRAEQQAHQRAYKEQQRRAAEQQKAEREARRPACTGCGTKLTDDRWKAAQAHPTPGPQWHPTLCDGCEDQAVEAASRAENEHQEQEQIPGQKAGGWFSRLRI